MKSIFLIVASVCFGTAALIFVPIMLQPNASSTVFWVAGFVFSLLAGIFFFVWRLLSSVMTAIDSSGSLHHLRGVRILRSNQHEADHHLISPTDPFDHSESFDDNHSFSRDVDSNYDASENYVSNDFSSSSDSSSSSSSDSSSSSSSDWSTTHP